MTNTTTAPSANKTVEPTLDMQAWVASSRASQDLPPTIEETTKNSGDIARLRTLIRPPSAPSSTQRGAA